MNELHGPVFLLKRLHVLIHRFLSTVEVPGGVV